jgi:hypothetical protein
MACMATQSDDLHRQRLAHVIARCRAAAAAAGELAPVPSEDKLEPVDPEAREALVALFRPGGSYWESSATVAASDPDLA